MASEVSRVNDMFKGELVEDTEVPFENLPYMTMDVRTTTEHGDSLIAYGTRGLIAEILRVMNQQREFHIDELFPHAEQHRLTPQVLDSYARSGILEDLGDGRYRAKETVFVKRARFKLPSQTE